MTVVPGATVQLGAVCAGEVFGSHRRISDATKLVDTPAALTVLMSFVSKLIDCGVFIGPLVSSGRAVGTGESWHIAPSTRAPVAVPINSHSELEVTVCGLERRQSLCIPPLGTRPIINSPKPFA